MAKSRKGKRAIKNMLIKQIKDLIEKKFKECPYTKRKELFLRLVEWAKNELSSEQHELFIKSLYEAEITQEVQMELALDRALSKINGGLSLEEKIALEKPCPIKDPNSDKPWAQRELERLKKVKGYRPLTDSEEETYNYCKGTLDSEDAEARYLNGEN